MLLGLYNEVLTSLLLAMLFCQYGPLPGWKLFHKKVLLNLLKLWLRVPVCFHNFLYVWQAKEQLRSWTITTFGGPLPFHSVLVESCAEVVGIWETKHKSAETMYTDYYGLLPLLVTSWEYIHTETRNVVTSTSRMNAVTIVQFIITTHDTHYVCHHRGEYQSLQKNAKDSFVSFLAWVFFGMN